MGYSSQNISSVEIDPASFRDPSGFVFKFSNVIYRAIAPSYFENFSLFLSSELYFTLSSKGLIIKHSEINNFLEGEYASYKAIQPDPIPFISYPYEWCFSQLKVAALLTLQIQKEALAHGMTLKDASAYNVQFMEGSPIFIDTLSFEKYTEGSPWIAYRQFCQHFLAPLALMCYKSAELSKLLVNFIDGIPLELAAALLPKKSFFNSVVFSHIYLHSKFQGTHSGKKDSEKKFSLSKKKLLTLIEHLEGGILNFALKRKKTAWDNYGETHNYSPAGKAAKATIISEWMKRVNPSTTWDLGSNTGEFSILAAQHSKSVLAMDSDHFCIESLYHDLSKKKIKNILPLLFDITNPSPSIGWNNMERKTISKRGKADLVLALALVHHLRISNNTSWLQISELFSCWGDWLIVEFIPKEDSQAQKMIQHRAYIFQDLDFESFEKSFDVNFEFIEKKALPDSKRILCLLRKKPF